MNKEEFINEFIKAAHRGSLLKLDNLGITIDSKKAYKKYAKLNNKKLNELTPQERTYAIGLEAWEQIKNESLQ